MHASADCDIIFGPMRAATQPKPSPCTSKTCTHGTTGTLSLERPAGLSAQPGPCCTPTPEHPRGRRRASRSSDDSEAGISGRLA